MKTYFLIYIVAALVFGCSSVPTLSEDNSYSETYDGINKESRIFIVPVKENYTDFEQGGKLVLQEIRKQLELNGWQVSTMSKQNHQDIWKAIIEGIGGIYSPATGRINSKKYEYALTMLVESISEADNYSAILIPSFLLKKAELKGQHAHWDGVSRKKLSAGAYTANMSWSGNTKGLSLELLVFSASGEWLFTSYGGLVLPFYTTLKNNKPVNEARDDMFEDIKQIKSGVNVSLLPILQKN